MYSLTKGGTTKAASTPPVEKTIKRKTEETSEGIKSIAVLPLDNMSGDPEQVYFTNGMHDALITGLAKIKALKVISRTSVLRYKGTDIPLPEIARELNVDAVIEGSVLRAGNSVRITAQLIHGASDEHIWAESYDRELQEVLHLQSDVAQAIAREIEIAVTPEEKTLLAARRVVNPETYELYLKGMFYLNKYTPEGFKKGLAYLHEAVEKDPAEPLAHTGLAVGYSIIGHSPTSPPYALPRAKAAALKALEIDETLAEAHGVLAEYNIYYDRDFAGAEQEYRRALELNPTLVVSRGHYAWFSALFGRSDEARAEMKRAKELDPLNPLLSAWEGWLKWWQGGQLDEALEHARKSLELNPDFSIGLYVLGAVYAEKGMFEEAIAAHKKAAAVNPDMGRWGLGNTYALAGRRDEALEIAAELAGESRAWNTFGLAEIYTALGKKDEAFRWLDAAYEQRHPYVPWVGGTTTFKSLRDDPRLKVLLKKMGLE